MDKAIIKNDTKILLSMTVSQALFLKSYLQNWISENIEPEDSHEIRKELFEALPEFEELHKYL